MALNYLLAWKPNLNEQDDEGHTPLHLAVQSVEEAETTRAVRFLLIEGARRDIPDKNGRIPIDLVKTEEMRETYQN